MTSNKKSRNITILQKLGLGENEALLYSLMLKRPKSTVLELQSWAPFPRTMLYYVLNNLKSAGLITATREGWRTKYIAQNPEHLYELLAKREQDFNSEMQSVARLIPDLKTTFRLASKRPDTQIFSGIDDYKIALENMLKSNPKIIYQYKYIGKGRIPGIEIREEIDKKRLNKRIDL